MSMRGISLSLALTLILTLAPAAARAEPKLGILIYRYEDAYVATVREAIGQALEGRADLTMEDGRSDQAIQNAQLDALVDVRAGGVVLDKIMEANLPVVFFNREPELDLLRDYDKAVFVGTNAADAGKMQGDIIKRIWEAHPEYDLNRDGKLQYLMFQGDPDNQEAIARSEWSVKQAGLNGVKMERLGPILVCRWDFDQAKAAMAEAWAAHEGRIELVVANNDSMALGAVAALAERGYNTADGAKFIPVVGVDATDPAVAAINQGRMSGTVKQDGRAMGEAAAAVILNLAAGKAPLNGTGFKFDESGLAVRIPYSPYTGAK